MKTAKVLSTAALTIVFSTLATLPAMAAEQPVSPKAEQSIQNSLPTLLFWLRVEQSQVKAQELWR